MTGSSIQHSRASPSMQYAYSNGLPQKLQGRGAARPMSQKPPSAAGPYDSVVCLQCIGGSLKIACLQIWAIGADNDYCTVRLLERAVHALAEIAIALRLCVPVVSQPALDFTFRIIGAEADFNIRQGGKFCQDGFSQLPVSLAGGFIANANGQPGFHKTGARCLDENNNAGFGHS